MGCLDRIERQLDIPPGDRAEIMRELRSHYEDLTEDLVYSGLNRDEAEKEAERQFERPESVASKLRNAHMRCGWDSALLAVFPFLALVMLCSVICSPNLTFARLGTLAFVGIVAYISVRAISEVKQDRRPVWLATWLAISLIWPAAVFPHVTALARVFGIDYLRQGQIINNFIFAGVMISVAMLAFWSFTKSRYWRIPVRIVAGVGVLSVFITLIRPAVQYGPLGAIVTLSWLVLVLTVAVRMFVLHLHGRPTESALFILAIYMAGFYLVAVGFTNADSHRANVSAFGEFSAALLVGFTTLVYARMTTYLLKTIALLAGLVLSCVFGCVSAQLLPSGAWASSGAQVVFTAGVAAMMIAAQTGMRCRQGVVWRRLS